MKETIRRVPLNHYVHIPKGTFNTPEELYKFMFISHRSSCVDFTNRVYRLQQHQDVYLLNNDGYEYYEHTPIGHKQFFIDSLGEL